MWNELARNSKEEQEEKNNIKSINKLSSFVQDNLDKLYTSTYYSQPSNKHDLDSIKNK